jgi:hypothetical protein
MENVVAVSLESDESAFAFFEGTVAVLHLILCGRVYLFLIFLVFNCSAALQPLQRKYLLGRKQTG